MGMIGNSLAQGLISGANIQDGTVDTPDIKDSAVTAAKIASGVVTPAKMDFSAGTANGVLYLNGSKVASSGSGLVFDGTNLGIGASSPSGRVSTAVADGSTNAFFAERTGASPATLAVTFANAYSNILSSGVMTFSTAATERMRIDSSGNVGIGTTLMGGKFNVKGIMTLEAISGSTNQWYAYTYTDNTLRFNYNGSGADEVQIDSAGNVGLAGTPSGYYVLETYGTGADSSRSVRLGTVNLGQSGGDYPWVGYNFRATTVSGAYKFHVGDYASAIRFQAGTVETYTTTSVGTAGNTISWVLGPYLARGGASWLAGSSDVRQKKNFEPSHGLAELMQVEAVKYHFEWDEDTAPKRLGFKAQNLLPIIPEMVVEKDKLHEDGTPLLTIAPDYMLPVLVKAIQEQQAIIEALTERITALETP
jgi:hypothetical protein